MPCDRGQSRRRLVAHLVWVISPERAPPRGGPATRSADENHSRPSEFALRSFVFWVSRCRSFPLAGKTIMVMPTPTRASGPRRTVRRDVNALRERRMRAVELFEAGMRQVDVVTQLGVSAQAASRWYHSWRTGGRDALVGAERLGRTARLSEQQLAEVQAALLAGPKAHGFATDMWTLARIAQVIE